MNKNKTIFDAHYQALIKELTKERVRLNISQGELAAKVGLNQSDVSKIENCEKRLDVLEFSLILRELRIQENIRLKNVVNRFIGITK